MLPYAHDGPASSLELSRVLSIALDVPRNLGVPVVGVRAGPHAMFGTSVPEAAVDKYGDTCGPEEDVDLAGTANGSNVQSVSKTPSMQGRPQCLLGPRVSLPVSGHDRANGR